MEILMVQYPWALFRNFWNARPIWVLSIVRIDDKYLRVLILVYKMHPRDKFDCHIVSKFTGC